MSSNGHREFRRQDVLDAVIRTRGETAAARVLEDGLDHDIAAGLNKNGVTAHELLTADEHYALALSGELASICNKIIGDGPQAAHDWAEMAVHIHGVQHMLMRQAAARAYPDLYRLLGAPTPRS